MYDRSESIHLDYNLDFVAFLTYRVLQDELRFEALVVQDNEGNGVPLATACRLMEEQIASNH